MNSERREDFSFFATVTFADVAIRHVRCRLWLPREFQSAIDLRLYPTEHQDNFFNRSSGPFAIRGRLKRSKGFTVTITASETWATVSTQYGISVGERETVVHADPIDLEILEARGGARARREWHSNYILTPPLKELAPFTVFFEKSNGSVNARTSNIFTCTIKGKRKLTFRTRYHYERQGEDTTRWSDFVAQERHPNALHRSERQLDDLDDFLLLASFAARYRIVCVAIEAANNRPEHFRYFRKDVTVPKKIERSDLDVVIDRSEFRSFLRQSYRRLVKTASDGPDELLRHALHFTVPPKDRTVEAEFISLFAALETLVLWHRRATKQEFIIEVDETWETFRKALRQWIKRYPALADSPSVRAALYKKLDELRRVPFADAFNSFCGTYNVNVADLWPVTGKEVEMPLSTIRNHIVHGLVFSHGQLNALGVAADHLRWTVERMFLSVLKWPLERAKIRPAWLAEHHNSMRELSKQRSTLQGVTLPPVASSEI